jgi:hypothetical protein
MTKTQSELTAGEREYLEHLRRSQERKSTPEYQASVNSNSIVMPNSPKTRLTSGTRPVITSRAALLPPRDC